MQFVFFFENKIISKNKNNLQTINTSLFLCIFDPIFLNLFQKFFHNTAGSFLYSNNNGRIIYLIFNLSLRIQKCMTLQIYLYNSVSQSFQACKPVAF